MKGTKGILAGLKELEKEALSKTLVTESKVTAKPNPQKKGTRVVQKNFSIDEYYEKLFRTIQLKRGMKQIDILKEALDQFSTEEEKNLARHLLGT